jgi:hypothetical protein
MDKIRTVVLYGSDLVVSTVGENLRGREGFQIFQIDPLLPDAFQRLDAPRPEVVLFDLAGVIMFVRFLRTKEVLGLHQFLVILLSLTKLFVLVCCTWRQLRTTQSVREECQARRGREMLLS